MENTNTLKTVTERGWRRGFANLFHQASDSFWRTKTWLVQTVVWLLFLNGMLALNIWQEPAFIKLTSFDNFTTLRALEKDPLGMVVFMFFIFSAMGLPIAAIIAGQDAIIGERQSGTAAWLLSKPVSRPAFILSRLFAGSLGILVTGVVIQGVIAYLQISLVIGTPYPFIGFFGAMGLMFLTCLFYLTLTYMLGSIFSSRGFVLGIGLAAALIGPAVLRGLPILKDITPWTIFMDAAGEIPPGISLAIGQMPASITPIIFTALWCLVFTAVAILRFRREEF